jgi:long-chain fatty acid transport protein
MAFGVSYHPSEELSFDLGYAHLFADDSRINKTGTGEDRFRGAPKGKYDAAIDILGAQLSWKFPF